MTLIESVEIVGCVQLGTQSIIESKTNEGMGWRMRGVEGRKPLLDHMLKWKKGGRGCGRAGVAMMGCKGKIYRSRIVWEELEG